MIAHVCASTGWTWDYVAEHIDLPRLEHLNGYWRQHPPMHILAAAYMGYKGTDAPQETQSGGEEAFDMLGGHELSESEFDALLKAKGIVS